MMFQESNRNSVFFEEELSSVRILHPQRHSQTIAGILAMLEELWGCGGGCNAYLTPAKSQGFAPHFDDIDAYALQIEGEKTWSFYSPLCEEEVLPRSSSRNFEQKEIGEPFLTTTLRPGDFAYFPRGVVHQARADSEKYSLHLTLSTGYCQSWYDFLSVAMPRALELAHQESASLRRTLPWNFYRSFGLVYEEEEEKEGKEEEDESENEGKEERRLDEIANPTREEVKRHLYSLCDEVLSHFPFDATADQMAILFQSSRLPPPSSFFSEPLPNKTNKKKIQSKKAQIRLSCSDAFRIVAGEDDQIALYSHIQNKPTIHAEQGGEEEEESIEPVLCLPIEVATSLEMLIKEYPRSLLISDLDIDNESLLSLLSFGLIQISR